MIAESMDQLDKMEQDLRKIITLYPDSAMAYNALGYTLADRGIRLDEALKLVLKAYQLSPEEPAILDSLGWVYYRMGDFKKAEIFLRKAYQRFPDAEIAAHFGELLWQMDKKEEAKTIWNKALLDNPDHEILRKTMDRFIKP